MNEHRSTSLYTRHRHDAAVSVARRPRLNKQGILAVLMVLLVTGFIGASIFLRAQGSGGHSRETAGSVEVRLQHANALSNLPAPDMLRPLTAQEAVAANAALPVVKRPDDPAAAFKLSDDATNTARALECLTQAVYYEAASEGLDGERAVAQVVLNRVRHPGYPNSVCGVVFQGSDQPTGCQFSFTCDGSLAKIPVGYVFARSRVTAREALAGRVFAPVGHATHYHADYVLPYWADSLDKVAVIGRHIFYRLRGTNGLTSAFSQRYSGKEPSTVPPLSTEVIEQGLDALARNTPTTPLIDLPKLAEDQVKSLDHAPKAATPITESLAADFTRGHLILGEPARPAKANPKSPVECGAGRVGRVKPIGPEDLNATTAKHVC